MEIIEELVVCKDQAQIMKGKRTKRQRLPSPLRLAMPSSSSSSAPDDNSGGFDIDTTSTEFRESTEEEEDMANCLILLAQGHTRKASSEAVPSPDNSNNKAAGLYLYECKTCNRCFPSFQALGGHRASHKKPKPNTESKQLQAVTFANEYGNRYDPTTSTTLSLQLSSSSSTRSKVHECSICGAEFSSGQALGGHMRRHRTLVNASTSAENGGSTQFQEPKKPRNVLKLDLNLPAPDEDHRESKFPYQSRENVLVFSASSLVDCHY